MYKFGILLILLLMVKQPSAQSTDTFMVRKHDTKLTANAYLIPDTNDKVPTINFNRGNSVKSEFLFNHPKFNQQQRDTLMLHNAVKEIQSRLYSFMPQSRSGSSMKVELQLKLLSASTIHEFALQTLKLPDDICKHIKSLNPGDRVVITKLQFTAYGNLLEVADLMVPYIIYLQ